MSDFVIYGGTIVDPASGYFGPGSVTVKKGRIAEVVRGKSKKGGDINASGLLVCPGLVDMHVHFREPGFEYKETIYSGSQAAAAGGFTSVACMPNTNPAIDNQETVKFILEKAKTAVVHVYPVGALTKNREGKELAEMGDMRAAGAVAFSDDGSGVQDNQLMRYAVEYCRMLGVPAISHCEYDDLADGGVINEGYISTKLGLRGRSRLAEELMIAREIMLAEYTGVHIHIAHVSTAGGVDLIRKAKKKGIMITAEVCPHHFALTDDLLKGYDTNFKVNPPLRTAKDIKAVKKGLSDGTIDAIATDHAPHAYEEKALEFDYAPPGMIGLETAVGLVSTELVKEKVVDWLTAVKLLSVTPACILNIPAGKLEEEAVADITIIDPDYEWTVAESDFKSLSKNSPYIGRKLIGRAVRTIVSGKTVFAIE